MLVDSGEVYDTRITGGRTGVFVFAQPGAIFSQLRLECKQRENQALTFDASKQDHVLLEDIITMETNVRWVVECMYGVVHIYSDNHHLPHTHY